MADGSDSDVSTGLNELEGKLRELERAFSTLGHELDPAPAATVVPPPPAPPVQLAPAPSTAPAPDDGVQQQIDALVRSHERLTATVQALVEDVTRIVDGLSPAEPPPAPKPPIAWAQPTPVHPLPLRVPEDPAPPPPVRSVRDYAPHPPSARAADDGG